MLDLQDNPLVEAAVQLAAILDVHVHACRGTVTQSIVLKQGTTQDRSDKKGSVPCITSSTLAVGRSYFST